MNTYEETKGKKYTHNNIAETLSVSQFDDAKSETLTIIISGWNIYVNISMSISIHLWSKNTTDLITQQ